MGQQSCYLCCKNSRKNKDLTFHKFPKDSGLCQKWKEACGLDAVDDASGFHICSNHFHEDIKKKFIIYGKKPMIKLMAGSVPSISVPFPPQLTCVIEPRCPSPDKSVMDSSQSSLETLNKAYSASANLEDDQLLSDASINCQEVALSTEIPNEDTNTRCHTPVTHNTSSYNGSDDTTTDVNQKNYTDNQVTEFFDNNSLCKKRRRFEPLYTKEIELSDFSTPKRASRVIQMVKKENEKLSHKNKSLLKQNNYYKNKIKTYKDLISHLKKQHLISKQMELSMMVKYDSSSDQN